MASLMESEDDIVITGMSGRFPESDSVEELARNLYAGVDMVSDDDRRWPKGLYGVNMSGGKIKKMSNFDALFFNVSDKQAHVMDPQLRMTMEVAYEAIIDAGICPTEMRGSKTAALACLSTNDAIGFWTSDLDKITGYEYTGGLPCMFANRVSYALDLRGPSHTVDAGCASSLTAIFEAVALINTGTCDAAIITGTNLCLSPVTTCALDRLKVLSPVMRCQSFDANAQGFVRSDAVVAILLQKRSSARRLYATVRAIGMGSEGYKPEGIVFPNNITQASLARSTLERAGLNPLDISYVEAHGTGTTVGDAQEITSIMETYCKDRHTPLLVGSVKSNIGHTESAAGLCSIVKVLIAMERGIIPSNLYYNSPNPKLPALANGKIKVVDKNTLWKDGLVSINCFGMGGAISCAVLESRKELRPLETEYFLPRLVTASGRTEAAVYQLLALAQSHKKNPELHSLIDTVHALNIPGHTYRGYALIGSEYLIETSFKFESSEPPPIYFIFTGGDTLWNGLDDTMLRIPAFRKSIELSAAIVQPYGIDLINIISDNQINTNVLCATVALVSLHVALVDLLRELDIAANGFFGYSIGEIGCGYADGKLTHEQAILIGYCCGYTFMDTELIEEAAPIISKKLQHIIPKPKERSDRWISSVLNNKWNSVNGKMCGAEYFAKTITSSVMISEDLQNIPERAIVVELSHRSELTTAVTGAAHTIIPLINGANDVCHHMILAIGRLYNAGAQPQVGRLYPPVKWPVSKGTPGLSSHVGWEHSVKWDVPFFGKLPQTGKMAIDCDLMKNEDAFIAGHKIDGRILYPVAGFLVAVWHTIARMNNVNPETTPIIIENACFVKSNSILCDGSLQCEVRVQKNTGLFEILKEDDVIATGTVRIANDEIVKRFLLPVAQQKTMEQQSLTADEMYKELNLRGYQYNGIFKGITSGDAFLNSGFLKWNENWISFIDTMLQFSILGQSTRDLYLPNYFQRVLIDPMSHLTYCVEQENICVHIYKDLKIIAAGGVAIHGVKWNRERRYHSLQTQPKLEKMVFVPNYSNESNNLSSQDALTAVLQLVIENVNVLTLKTLEVVVERQMDTLMLPEIMKVIDSEPQIRLNAFLAVGHKLEEYKDVVKELNIKVITKNGRLSVPENNCDLIVGANLVARRDAVNLFRNLASALSQLGMIMIKESLNIVDNRFHLDYLTDKANLVVVSRQVTDKCQYILMRRRQKSSHDRIVIEITDDEECSWIYKLATAMKRSTSKDARVYLVSYHQNSGILGLYKCLQKEAGGPNLRVYFLPQAVVPFLIQSPIYAKRVEEDLVINILKNGIWGTYRHLQLEDQTTEVEEAFLNILKKGDFQSLRWIESSIQVTDDRELCNVHYAALSERDLINFTNNIPTSNKSIGLYNNESMLGTEFSGRTLKGRRVMGIASSSGLATKVLADNKFLWEVPENWSLEEAATVPVAYITAYTALVVKGNMKRGESILIHDGGSDVGQAAICLANHAGCEVYVTTDTEFAAKRLLARYLELKADNVGNYRDSSFQEMILQGTAGCGVDLVLNSLECDQFLPSLRCLGEGGRFVDLGNLDHYKISCHVWSELSSKAFFNVKIYSLSDYEKDIVHNCVKNGIVNGAVLPLYTRVYNVQQLEDAFSFMSNGQQIDKILVRLVIKKSKESESTAKISAVPRMYLRAEKSYILVGGFGGMGIELSQWLVRRGATKLLFNSRSEKRTGYQSWWIRRLQEKGVNIVVSTDDVTTIEGSRALLKQAMELGDVGGIFNLAGVLREKMFLSIAPEDFQLVLKPKVKGTEALDAASREVAHNLDHFVVFSSFSSGRGVHGLSSYGLANSVMERIMEQRKADGLPGIAIQWGPIGGVGMLAENKDSKNDDKVFFGARMQPIHSCMEMLDRLLLQNNPVVACTVVASKHSKKIITNHINIQKSVADVLGIKDIKKMPQMATLVMLGMDSLMAAVIQKSLEKNYNILLSIDDVNCLTFDKLRALEQEILNKQK